MAAPLSHGPYTAVLILAIACGRVAGSDTAVPTGGGSSGWSGSAGSAGEPVAGGKGGVEGDGSSPDAAPLDAGEDVGPPDAAPADAEPSRWRISYGSGHRSGGIGVWTGSLWITGGGDFPPLGSGGPGPTEAYDPAADSWRVWKGVTPFEPGVWTGSQVVTLWAGGATIYDATADDWVVRKGGPAGSPRQGEVLLWLGREALWWGGDWDGQNVAGGWLYDVATDAWRPAPAGAGEPEPRSSASAVVAGNVAFVWGGFEKVGFNTDVVPLGDGAVLDLSTEQWRPISSIGAPAARWGASALWTGTEVLVLGGQIHATLLEDCAAYDPASDQWRPLAPAPLPFGWAVWTGTEVLAIGAWPGHVIRYTPSTDEWKTLDAIPHAMHLRAVAWTGTELLLWADWSAEVALYTPPA